MSLRRSLAVTAAATAAFAALAGVFAGEAAADTGPDFVLTANFTGASPPEGPISLEVGDPAQMEVHLRNVGDTDDTGELRIDLAGLDVDAVDVRDLDTGSGAPEPVTCVTAGTVVTCPVPNLPAGSPEDHRITVTAPVSDAPADSQFSFVATVTPTTAPDPTPENDSASMSGTVFVPPVSQADLRAVLAPHGDIALVAGVPTAFTLTATNAGPDAAAGVTAGAVLQTNDDGFTVTSTDPRVTVTRNGTFTSVSWAVGDLAVGAKPSVPLTVTAATVGTTGALLSGSSAPGNADPVPCYTIACLADDSARFTVVAAPPAPASTAPELAATGSADRTLAVVGGLLVLTGAGVTVATRRRRDAV